MYVLTGKSIYPNRNDIDKLYLIFSPASLQQISIVVVQYVCRTIGSAGRTMGSPPPHSSLHASTEIAMYVLRKCTYFWFSTFACSECAGNRHPASNGGMHGKRSLVAPNSIVLFRLSGDRMLVRPHVRRPPKLSPENCSTYSLVWFSLSPSCVCVCLPALLQRTRRVERIDGKFGGPKKRIHRDWSTAGGSRIKNVRKRRAVPPAKQVTKELCKFLCEWVGLGFPFAAPSSSSSSSCLFLCTAVHSGPIIRN